MGELNPIDKVLPPAHRDKDLYRDRIPETLMEAYMEATEGSQLESIDGEIGLLRTTLISLIEAEDDPMTTPDGRKELRDQTKAICDAIEKREGMLRNRKLYVHIKDVMRMIMLLEGIAREYIPDARARARFFERCRSIALEGAR